MAPIWKLAVASAIALAVTANAHMNLFYPPPLGGENNPHRTDPPEPRIDYPYNCCGEEVTPFPCRGYLKFLGTPQGRPVATWEAGSVQNFSLVGEGTHWGGSCQVGFSVDKGKTWQVVRSYEGACPHREFGSQDPENQAFEFTVPPDMPAGDHVFAWTWINREREFFMSCAPVTIVGGAEGVAVPGGNVTDSEPSSPGISQPVPAPSQAPPPGPPELQVPGMTYIRPEPQDPQATDTPAIISIPAAILSSINSPNPTPTPTPNKACHAPSLSNPPQARIPLARRRELTRPSSFNQTPSSQTTQTQAKTKRAPEIPYHSRPGFLVANLGNGCETARSLSEVKYPNPGPDVVEGDGVYPLELPGPAERCGL